MTNATAEDRPAGRAPDAVETLMAPKRAFDSRSFEELAKSYNLETTSNNRMTFTRLVIAECRKRSSPVRVLDIGCGRGIGRRFEYVHAIRPHVTDLWGIEPDDSVMPEGGLFDHFEPALMESATLPENFFHVAYAYMVMEHVTDPAGFMRAVARCLAPGGVFMFATPNAKHYFTRIAKFTHAIKLDELTLALVKGRDKVEGYHYPVVYRFNDERTVRAHAASAGLSSPLFAHIEAEGPRGYTKGVLRPFYHLMRLKRKVIRNPKSLLTLYGRIAKPG